MFSRKKAKPRTCPEGHVLEESWEQCPYCTAASKEREESKRAIVVAKPTQVERRLAGWLVAIGGELDGRDFRLREGRNVLGKGDKCDVVLPDPQLSERHAVVEYRADEATWSIEDLDSKRGTWRNGERVGSGEPHPIEDGDRLRVGRTDLFFRAFAPHAPEADE